MTRQVNGRVRSLSIPFLLATFALADFSAPSAEAGSKDTPETASAEPAALCYPPYWGGLLPGFSTDAELLRLYGPGVFRETGHDGTRHYTDKQRRLTLSVSWATDRRIAEIEIRRGYHPPVGLSSEDANAMISSTLTASPTFGNYHALTLNSTPEEVRQNLGPPHSTWVDDTKGTTNWVYDSQCSCELPAGISLEFKSGELVAVCFWSSPG